MKSQRASGLVEAFELAFDTLRRNPLRSFLTVLGIVIGVATVIAVSAVVNGLNTRIVGSVESLGSNVILCYRFQWASLGRPPSDWMNRPELRAEWSDDIAKLPHVLAAGPGLRIFQPQFGTGTSTLRHAGRETENVILEGDSPSYQDIWNVDLARGRWFNETDEEHHRLVVVLGRDAAQTLFPNPGENPVGQEVSLQGHVFTVIGVAAPSKQISFGGSNPEDNRAAMPLSAMEKLYPANRDFVLFAKADSAANVAQVVDEIRDLLRRERRLLPSQPDNFAVFTLDVFIDLWKQLTVALFGAMFAVGSVALMVGGIGVMNIMLVSVTERTHEIGLRKAVGATRRNILAQFLAESAALSTLGGAIGVLLGAGLGLSLRLAFPSLPARISLFWVVLGLVVSGFVGIFFGVYPAWKAARLDPVAALRYE
ncbi:MAG TPA: ABC transporter permease [Candidatus Acidoferrales bacterium]|nr:ABC transporter permease [Candidatus Acidoferrales bacterium]